MQLEAGVGPRLLTGWSVRCSEKRLCTECMGKVFRLPSALALGMCSAPNKQTLGYHAILYARLPQSAAWKSRTCQQ